MQCLPPLLLQSKIWLVHCLLQEPASPSHHTKADESSTTRRKYLQGRAEHSEEDSGRCGHYSTDRGPETPVSEVALFSEATHHFKGSLPYLFPLLRSISPSSFHLRTLVKKHRELRAKSSGDGDTSCILCGESFHFFSLCWFVMITSFPSICHDCQNVRSAQSYIFVSVCLYLCLSVCTYVCLYLCLSVCTYVCLSVC